MRAVATLIETLSKAQVPDAANDPPLHVATTLIDTLRKAWVPNIVRDPLWHLASIWSPPYPTAHVLPEYLIILAGEDSGCMTMSAVLLTASRLQFRLQLRP